MRTQAVCVGLLVLGLAACGEKETPPSAPSTSALPVRRLFLANLEGVDAFVVGDDGRLASQARLTPTRGITPNSVVAADGKFLYLSNQGGLEGYRIDATTGTLSALPGSPFAPERFGGLVADPRGRFVWLRASTATGGTLATYRIDAATGALARVAGGLASYSGLIWVEPQGRFAFASQLQELWVYRIDDAGSMTATARSPFTLPREAPNVHRMAFSRTAPFVFVASRDDGGVSSRLVVFRLDPATGEIGLSSIHPTPGDRTPSSIVVNDGGTVLYAAMRNTLSTNTQPPALYAYRIDGSTGALTDTANVSVPARMNVFSSDLGLSSDGKLLFMTLEPTPFVLPLGAADLAVFRVDGPSMTQVGTPYTVGSDPHTFHSFETRP